MSGSGPHLPSRHVPRVCPFTPSSVVFGVVSRDTPSYRDSRRDERGLAVPCVSRVVRLPSHVPVCGGEVRVSWGRGDSWFWEGTVPSSLPEQTTSFRVIGVLNHPHPSYLPPLTGSPGPTRGSRFTPSGDLSSQTQTGVGPFDRGGAGVRNCTEHIKGVGVTYSRLKFLFEVCLLLTPSDSDPLKVPT